MIDRDGEDIPVIRPYMPDMERFLVYAREIWAGRWLTNGGPLVRKLQTELAETLKVEHAVVFANGHLALDSALKALNLCDGEAITTPYTYLSTANALHMNGLKPVFCDIKESDCTIDEEKIEPLITGRTKVIVPVHVYGFPCNHHRIQEIADRHGLKIVYDAAHAFRVTVDGKGIGTLGDASMFSFHATKVFHTVEGGAVTFKDPRLERKLISAKNFGLITYDEADTVSFNAKMSELHAAMGLVNLETVEWQIQQRKALVEHYIARLSQMDRVRLFHWDRKDVNYNYAYFPILFEGHTWGISRDKAAEELQNEYHIQTRKYFYPLLSKLRCYREQCAPFDTPVAKDISNRVLTLPLFVEMTHDQVEYICDAIEKVLMH